MRLLAMGLVPGTEVAVRSRAPMGDPTSYGVKCYSLSLRRDEAACVLVEPQVVKTLADAAPGTFRVVGIGGGRGVRAKLWAAGIAEDVVLTKDESAARGPVAVRVQGRSARIGRGMAAKVQVVVQEQGVRGCEPGTGAPESEVSQR
jgi:Fe2+ transport system protein FeoA